MILILTKKFLYNYLEKKQFLFLFLLQLTVNDVYLSYLPLAHIFDRVIEEAMINHGASIGFWRGVRRLYFTFQTIETEHD